MRRIILFIFLCFGSTQLVTAQTKLVTGTVTAAEDGSPLPGVNVLVKGTTNGTVTDNNGKYSIEVRGAQDVLIFSFIGLKAEEVVIGERTTLDVSLRLDVTQLSEVVVTGVGIATEKRKVAIEVSSLKANDIPKTAVASIDQALQGKIAGAQIQLNSGAPGAAAAIQLRGINSLGSYQPMILIDGVQVSEGNGNSALQGLDMTNIERIEVVKGAAGGMLYGAQGANGVIQIFTKKGAKNSRPNITISSKIISDEILRGKNDLVANKHHFETNADGFIIDDKGNPIAPNANGSWSTPVELLSPTLLNNKEYKEQTYNGLDVAYKRAVSHNTTINIAGGGSSSDYNANVNYLEQENARFGKLKRLNIGVNNGFELAKGLTVRNILQLQFEESNLLSGNRFGIINSYPYINFNATLPNGYKVAKTKTATNELNPLSELDWRTRVENGTRLIENFNVNYKFPKYLELDYKYGIQLWNTNTSDIYKNQIGLITPAGSYWGTASGAGQVYQGHEKSVFQNSLFNAFLKFDLKKDLGLNIPLTSTTQASYDWRKETYDQFDATSTDVPLPPYNLNIGLVKTNSAVATEFVTFGYLVNQSFDYGNLAGISLGFRSDFSSEFGFNEEGKSAKPFTFPRGTFYFNASELLNLDRIPAWKIRGAYGEAGIQPFTYARQNTLGGLAIGNAYQLYTQSTSRNPQLKIQRSKELEIGTDITLSPNISDTWLNKVDLSFTYWKRTSSNVIQGADRAPSSGVSKQIDNLITLGSNGIELALDLNVYDAPKVKWNSSVRFGKAITVVDDIANDRPVVYDTYSTGTGNASGFFAIREGEKFGVFYGQKVLTSLNETRPDGSRYIAEANLGDYEVVETLYGKAVINKNTKRALVTDTNDKRVIGNPQPKFFMSFIQDVTLFNKLTINVQVDWTYKQSIYNATRQWLYRDRISEDFDHEIKVNGESGAYVAFYNSLYNNVNPLSWFVEDGSFARLRNLSITYDLASVIKKPWLKQCSVFIAGRNLLTFTNYRGLDPEAVTNGAAVDGGRSLGSSSSTTASFTGPSLGIDGFSFPNLRSYQAGITIGF